MSSSGHAATIRSDRAALGDRADLATRYVQHYADAKTAIVEQIIAHSTPHRPGPRQE